MAAYLWLGEPARAGPAGGRPPQPLYGAPGQHPGQRAAVFPPDADRAPRPATGGGEGGGGDRAGCLRAAMENWAGFVGTEICDGRQKLLLGAMVNGGLICRLSDR